MPRAWEYSPARRYAMQIAMWLVFAATLGLAHVVSTHRARAERIDLDDPINLGDVRVRLPRDWDVNGESEVSIVAEDPGRHRRIELAEVASSPGQNLQWILARHVGVALRSVQNLEFPRLKRTGIMARSRRTTINQEGRLEMRQVVEAAVVISSGKALVVQIEHAGPRPDKSDEDLLKRIVAAITSNPGPSLRNPEQDQQ